MSVAKRIIEEDKDIIAYRPSWKKITGSITSAILLQQIFYWWGKQGKKPYYKFIQPPRTPNSKYKDGDSWTEELGFTAHEYRTAFDKIGRKLKKDELDHWEETLDGYFVGCFTTQQHETYFYFNEAYFEKKLDEHYGVHYTNPNTESLNGESPNGEIGFGENEKSRIENPQMGNADFAESGIRSPILSEITTETTTSNTNVLEGGEPQPPPENLISQNGSTAQINISILTVKSVKQLKLSAAEWTDLLAEERGARNRVGVVEHIERQLNPTPPAILMYQQKSGRMPSKDLWDSVVSAVGDADGDIARWGETIIWWRGHGYNPTNVFGMIEKFKENDLGDQNGQSTTSGSSNGNASAESKTGGAGGNARKLRGKPLTDAQKYVKATEERAAAHYAKISQ